LTDRNPPSKGTPMTAISSTPTPVRLRVAATVVAVGTLALAGCGGSSKSTSGGGKYDSVIKSAPVASSGTVSGNAWAAKIKKQGYLRVGGTDAGPLFSLKNIKTGELTGFDAGLAQMLSRYITGKSDVKSLTKLTITTVETRETLLQNHSVDAVFATYTITPERAKKVDFAGPYYESGDAIMVKKSNSSIKSVADLKGKKVATESESTAAQDIKQRVPSAKVTLFKQDAECVAAVQQGRVDAYVLDQGILISDASSNPQVKVVGQPFTKEPYGIGLPKDNPAAKQFVDAWLKTIFKDGTWAKLWKATIGTVVTGQPPSVPAIGSVSGS
jgi:glutamate transport system substrate-binding protein